MSSTVYVELDVVVRIPRENSWFSYTNQCTGLSRICRSLYRQVPLRGLL